VTVQRPPVSPDGSVSGKKRVECAPDLEAAGPDPSLSTDTKETRNSAEATDSLSSLTHKNVEIIAALENAANAQRSRTDRIADVISSFVGSMMFVYLHVLWFGFWIVMGTVPWLPKTWRFDPFPFTFLTFVVSLEAIFLSTFILISQNHEERVAKRRNHLDLQINLLSEQENSQMLKMLESIQAHLHISKDAETDALKEAARPEEMVAQIKDVIESSDHRATPKSS
jgi:uncharacterized membrane protein